MKKWYWMVLCLCGLLGLTGCGEAVPETAADGAAWNDGWINVGNVLGVDAPEGMTIRENSDALDAKGMYYASWSTGEAESISNEDGDGAEIYDAQVSLLLAGYRDTGKAEEAAAEWRTMAEEQYAVEETSTQVYNGQEFTVLTCTYPSETNPYARGASAFGVYGNYAISVELSCREGFDGDALEILGDFLEHCHYAA